MNENLEKVKLLARDLRNGKQFPRGPRQGTLGGYVLAARAVDKCRAVLSGTEGEYPFELPSGPVCPASPKSPTTTFARSWPAAPFDEIATWISKQAKPSNTERIVWNKSPARSAPERSFPELQEYGGLHCPVYSAKPRDLPLVRCLTSKRNDSDL
ncbi:MAG: DUF5069 domain-containing protein [Verrucomicrobiota bacterium]